MPESEEQKPEPDSAPDSTSAEAEDSPTMARLRPEVRRINGRSEWL
ncbi:MULTISPECIES: hypothetical protein [Kitasatospora]|nr:MULTISPECIES: hypothetical protein [Kitasatospora]